MFVISAFALVMIYDKGKDQKPLRYADVPQETIDWINSLSDGLDDIAATFTPEPIPTPWDNEGDLGKDDGTGLKTLEDELFIFYFTESLTKQAYKCQKYAHQAIPRLEEIIGKYYYPADMNGRKVAIYLMPDQQEFDKITSILFGEEISKEGVEGVTVQTISPSGTYLKGIVLNGKYCFKNDEHTKTVLWHEMTHYCHISSLDYNMEIDMPKWCTEGLADYVGEDGKRPTFTEKEIAMMRQDCDFTKSYFPYEFENYEGGHSIFCYMEDEYTLEGVKRFLKTTYTNKISPSFEIALSKPMKEFEREWKSQLERW